MRWLISVLVGAMQAVAGPPENAGATASRHSSQLQSLRAGRRGGGAWGYSHQGPRASPSTGPARRESLAADLAQRNGSGHAQLRCSRLTQAGPAVSFSGSLKTVTPPFEARCTPGDLMTAGPPTQLDIMHIIGVGTDRRWRMDRTRSHRASQLTSSARCAGERCWRPRRALSSQTPTSRCRSAAAGRRGRARESPPGAGHAATGTRAALRPRRPARQLVRP